MQIRIPAVQATHRSGRSHGDSAPSLCGRSAFLLTVLGAASLTQPASQAFADDSPPISIGAGMRTSFDTTDPSAGKKTEDFNLDSVRLYVNGAVTSNIKFTFNTEYQGSPPSGSNSVEVLDAIARFEFSDKVNIWAGRFLPPSDRANLYGPYYANQWTTYKDGVQDGYESVAVGRDNGVAYWGQFGILKVSAGAFDVPSTTGNSHEVYAARAQLDFWDAEGGYYLNGTYYGEKDILALGVAEQNANGNNAYNADFLLEKKLPWDGVVSIESEYAKYDHFGGYAADESNGYYVLGSYLFPQVVGIGKFQVLYKYAHTNYDYDLTPVSDTQKTNNVELNYVIKAFNARVSLYYLDVKYDHDIVGTDYKAYGIGVQLQM
jgi:hypothetical protein